MVMYSIRNSIQIFGQLVKARLIKWLQKLPAKTQAFALACELIWTCCHTVKRICDILNIFLLLDSFFASSSMKIYCYWTFCHVSFILLPFFGNFRFLKLTVDFCIFHLQRPLWPCLFNLFASFKYIFLSFIHLLQNSWEKN